MEMKADSGDGLINIAVDDLTGDGFADLVKRDIPGCVAKQSGMSLPPDVVFAELEGLETGKLVP